MRLTDGSRAALHSGSDSVVFWQLRTGVPAERLVRLSDTGRNPGDGDQAGVSRAKHARPNEDFPFAVTLDGRTITLWPTRDYAFGRERIVLTGHGAEVTDADAIAAPDQPAVIVSSSIDGTVRVWDVAADVQADPGGKGERQSAAIVSTLTHEGRTLGLAIATTQNQAIAVLDLDTGERVGRLDCPSGLVLAAACGWVPGVGPAAITFANGVARIWRLSDGALMAVFKTNVDAVKESADRLPMQAIYIPVPGQPLAATCGHSEKAVIWDLRGRRIYGVLGRHRPLTSVLACGVTRKGTPVVATAGRDNKIDVWNAVRGRRVSRVKLVAATTYVRHPDSGYATAISLHAVKNEQSVILVLCEDGKLRIFQKRRWRPGYKRTELDAHGAASLTTMRLTDGRIVAVAGGRDGRLCVWDLEVVLKSLSRGESHIPALINIETEVAITGLSATSEDTVASPHLMVLPPSVFTSAA